MVALVEARKRRWQEGLIVYSMWAGGILALAGMALAIYREDFVFYGVLMQAVALLIHVGGQMASHNMETMRVFVKATRGSDRYEQLKRWTRLKTSSALHNMLILFGSLTILVGLVGRMGLVEITLTGYQADRALTMFVFLIAANSFYAHYQSLRVRLEPDRTAGTRVLFWSGHNLAALVALFAAYLVWTDAEIAFGFVALHATDAPILLVGAFTITAIMLGVGRGLPSLFAIVADPRTVNRGGYASQQKSVLMPTMVAFTLLFIFLLLIVIFGAGIFSVLNTVTSSRSVVVVLAVMVLAVVGGVATSFYLARQEDKVELFRESKSREQQIAIWVLSVSGFFALVLLVAAVWVNRGREIGPLTGEAWIHLASLGLMTAVGPYGFYAAHRGKHTQNIEVRFPDFLRDLASSHKGGLTLVQSVQVAARGEYGALSPEIQRLADQLSWNVSFDEAFRRFGQRVATPLVERSVNLVLEAGRSGGSTTDVLLAAARDAREIKNLERERRLNMSVYTTVIYVTFMVFLFVIGVLVGQFLPEILAAGEATANSELDLQSTGLNLGGVEESDYRQFYFIAGSVQAIGNGILAGIMGSGSSSLGLRHAFIMLFITYITFGFIL